MTGIPTWFEFNLCPDCYEAIAVKWFKRGRETIPEYDALFDCEGHSTYARVYDEWYERRS